MFKYKNAMISMAVVAMLAACGGGGGGGDDDSSAGGGGTNNPPAGGGTGVVAPTTDQKLAGDFSVANVLAGPVVIGVDDFISKEPRTGADNTGGYGIYGVDPTAATDAPLDTIGLRLAYDNSATAETTSRGRIAFELKDQATTEQEVLQIMIDQVDVTVTPGAGDAPDTVSFAVPSTAKMYVYAKNSAGQEANVSLAADDALVIDAQSTPTVGGDLVTDVSLDVNAAVLAAKGAASGQALSVINSIRNFSAPKETPFEVSLSYSNLSIVRGADPVTVPAVSVTKSGVAGVANGGGLTGYSQFEARAAAVE
ncbi:hypothetical protein Q8A64_02320 [Oxalobacteraceae bacterium R-40]|uniref:Uncharacterized protein n=1 Tax=Keguizhuia sedimenti TaxID=3064264 RepID=A0ABU1BLN6_9BURK|nr:hypothetical protein [Oxalobacteraceae bacterium R-40]